MFTSINEHLKREALNLPRIIKAICHNFRYYSNFFCNMVIITSRLEKFINFTFDYCIAILIGICIAIPIFVFMDFYKVFSGIVITLLH